MAENGLALVTGGAQGIGYASAEALQADGFQVVLADIDAEGVAKAAETLGGGTRSYACDMGDAQAVLALFDQNEAELGVVKVLVNNAGVAMPGDFLDYDLATFERVIDINLKGVFVATQRAAKKMVETGLEGAIVNMSSINGQLAIPAIPAYWASKGGVMGLTKSNAADYVTDKVRCNARWPGTVLTPWLKARMAAGGDDDAAYETVLSRQPTREMATAEDIAPIVVYLASDESKIATGQFFVVDGGWTI